MIWSTTWNENGELEIFTATRQSYGPPQRFCVRSSRDRKNMNHQGGSTMRMTFRQTAKAILTDIHFLIPVAVLCIGVALLVQLY
jgi:hypothetical protein